MQEILFSATLVLSIAYAVFISWCIIGWLKTENFLPENRELNQKCFVSVIIPARNEAENIIACLSDFLQQDYPPEFFEVIVADDHSEDDTAKLAQQFITDHPGIQVRLLKMENKFAIYPPPHPLQRGDMRLKGLFRIGTLNELSLKLLHYHRSIMSAKIGRAHV